jgi:hypothetical protein
MRQLADGVWLESEAIVHADTATLLTICARFGFTFSSRSSRTCVYLTPAKVARLGDVVRALALPGVR